MNEFPPEICSWEYTIQGMAGPLLSRGDSPDLIHSKKPFRSGSPGATSLDVHGIIICCKDRAQRGAVFFCPCGWRSTDICGAFDHDTRCLAKAQSRMWLDKDFSQRRKVRCRCFSQRRRGAKLDVDVSRKGAEAQSWMWLDEDFSQRRRGAKA